MLTVGKGGSVGSSTTELVPGEALVTWQAETILQRDVADRQRDDLTHRFALQEAGAVSPGHDAWLAALWPCLPRVLMTTRVCYSGGSAER